MRRRSGARPLADELRERLSNLPHTGRTDGMAVADQTAASVDGQMAGKERRCAAFNQLRALASLGEAEDFVVHVPRW